MMGLSSNGNGAATHGLSEKKGSEFPTIEEYVGRTPLVRLQRLRRGSSSNLILAKLEGNNPAGSVKDRPALSMIQARTVVKARNSKRKEITVILIDHAILEPLYIFLISNS